VKVKLTRGSEAVVVDLALQQPAASTGSVADTVLRRYGVKVTAVSKAAVAAVNPDLRGGLYLDEVTAGGPAAAAGLAKGDVLIGVHLWETLTPDHLLHVFGQKDYASFLPLKVYYIRAGKLREVALTPES
jgi:serine protease Do